MLDATRREFEAAYGRVKRGEIALIGMGKLGGREMTATSDIDLILLYDFDEKAAGSDGERSLPGVQYFTRLTQRLVAALSAPTAEGTLYAVDFRLRPSGNAGPLATHIDGFAAYQAKDAWTWERMALTRARVIAGDKGLAKNATAQIRKILTAPRDRAKILADILDMRAMVEDAKGGEGAWDLKQAPGGLVDIEFVAQALLLQHAHEHPQLISTETETVLAAAAAVGVLPLKEADILLPALRLYQALTQMIRLCLTTPFDPETAPRALLERLARTAELPDFSQPRRPCPRDGGGGAPMLRAADWRSARETAKGVECGESGRACPAAFREVRDEACLARLPGNNRGVGSFGSGTRPCGGAGLAVQPGRGIRVPRHWRSGR